MVDARPGNRIYAGGGGRAYSSRVRVVGVSGGGLQLGFQVFDGRQAAFQRLREGFEMPELGDADRRGHVAERVFDNQLLLGFAEDQADARLVGRVLQEIVDDGQVEVHLAGILRFERPGFQIDNDKAAQLDVVEQQIDAVFLALDFQRILAAEKREADSKLQQELLQVGEQGALDVALLGGGREREEVEVVGVLKDLLGEVGLRRGQGTLEVGNRLALRW